MAHTIASIHALALLIAANATPVIVAKLANDRWSAPLDFGHVLRDGQRLFGAHKTWRGLVSGVLAGTIAAALTHLPLWVGAGFAMASLLGDALSSAVKRRMKLQPGREIPGLDQLGEALLPLVLFAGPLSLDGQQIALVTIVFCVLDLASARLRHREWLR
jgi:CDP-diglyceride synthetase